VFLCWPLLPQEPLTYLIEASGVLQCSQQVLEQQAEGPCYHPNHKMIMAFYLQNSLLKDVDG